MPLMRYPRRCAKQLVSFTLILAVWMSWVTVPVYSSRRSTPPAKATKAKSSKPAGRPSPVKIATSDSPALASAPIALNQPTQEQCVTPPAGMVSWWPGDGHARDIQDGNHGTLRGDATFAPGLVGQAFSFDGVNDYVAISNAPSLTLNAQFTIEFWMRPSVTISPATPSAPYLLAKGPNDSIGFANSDGRIEVRGFPSRLFSTTDTWTAGTWYHIALTFDVTGYKLFVNGVQEASVTNSYSILSSSNELSLGGEGARNSFNGQLDEVTINSRALTASEIQSIYNAGSAGMCRPQCTPPPSNMVSWWPGDGTADDIQDGNPGTLQGGATFASGLVNQSFSLDGVDDYVEIPDSPNLTPPSNSITLEAWVKPNTVNGGVIIGKYDSSTTANGVSWGLSMRPTGRVVFAVYQDVGGSIARCLITDNSVLTAGAWQHVAAIFDVATQNTKIYVNGVEVPSSFLVGEGNCSSTISSIYDSNTPVRIGTFRGGSGFTGFWNGLIDEASIYNRALSASEIQTIYNAGSAGKCRPGSLASLTLNPATVTGGQPSIGTVTLRNPAPAGGALITLNSSDTSVATVLPSITIPEGATSHPFTITTSTVVSTRTVDISATYGTETRTARLTVTAALPDLQVASSPIAPSQTQVDQEFDLTWTLTNTGQSRANGPWVDKIYRSTDDRFDGDDRLITQFTFSQSLNPGESRERIQRIIIPRAAIPADGQYYLIVQTDANGQVTESDETNNWRASNPITIPRPRLPDLTVEDNIEAPATAFFDGTIRVRWRVRNIGTASTDASEWHDRLSLGRSPTGDEVAQVEVSNVSYLNVGESYVASADLRIPRGIAGTHYIIVKTDSRGAITEEDENNNTRNRPINIEIPTLPDLQVPSVQVPISEAFPGQAIFINWRVENRGTGRTPPTEGVWVDGIYLSRDETFDRATDRQIGTRQHQGGLPREDGFYLVNSYRVVLPRDVMGEYYVFVSTDDENRVYEYVYEGNNTNYERRPITVTATPPDLVVQSVTAPATATAARQITVNWTVRNQGAFVASPNWFDTVYLSTDATLEPATDRPLATVFRASSLPAGQSYSTPASATVTLPPCINGTYYLFVFTDSRNQIFEFDSGYDAEANNFSPPHAIQITAMPPDLQVTSVGNPPPTGEAGQSISLTWTVRNEGAGPTVESSWVDRVYFSPTPEFSTATALLAATVPRSGVLAQGEPYPRTENVTIPRTARGAYYIVVWTDAFDQVEECDDDNNNINRSQTTIFVNNEVLPEPPDLTITSVSPPSSAFAGQTITVQWTGRNAGPGSLQPSAAWNDAVFFSTDSILDGSDQRIATQLIRGPLAIGASYPTPAQAQATIPFVAAGTYHLIVKADSDNHVSEQREDNNTNFMVIPIDITSVDLQVTNVDALPDPPATARSGQEMTVTWTVRNNGAMGTFASQWTDYVYLSRDQILDETDRTIGYRVHSGALEGGASYDETLSATVPSGLTGQYYVFVRTDRNNQVVETDETNNISNPDGVLLELPPLVDLIVTNNITPPVTATPGEQATFQWIGQNIGRNTTTGRWRDAVYLSTDRDWDVGDALVGYQERSGPLAPMQTYPGELRTILPAVDPGQYYVIVRADVRNNVREDDETNNTTASTNTAMVDVAELQLGVPYPSTLQTGQERYHKVNVPGNETLLFTLDAEQRESSTELFVRQGAMASLSAYDFLFSRPYEAYQEVVVPDTFMGWYYSLSRGVYVPGGTTPFTIKAEIIPFSIRTVSPERIGDNGQVTLTLRGARFQQGATVKLVRGSTELTAAQVRVLDSATVKARFFFTNAPHGVYDIVLTNPGDAMVTAPQAVTIETATRLQVNVGATGNLSPRVGQATSMYAAVTNTGNVDAPYVSVIVQIGTDADIGSLPPATWKIIRPASSYPRPVVSTGDATIEDPQNITVGSFIVRDLEPGQVVPFRATMSNITRGFRVRALVSADTSEDFINRLRGFSEQVRLELLQQPSLELPPDFARSLGSADEWWAITSGYLVAGGLIDQTAAQQGDSINLARGDRPLNDSDHECEQICHSACTIVGRVIHVYSAASWLGCLSTFVGNPAGIIHCTVHLVGEVVAVEVLERLCSHACETFCNPPPPPDCPQGQVWSACGERIATPDDTIRCVGACIQPTNPVDPNDKIGPQGFGPQAFVGVQQPLPYTINFENLPTATAYAQRIRIVDQLDPNLDWRTFRLREIGFGNYRITVPENRAFFQGRIQLGEDLGNLIADISAGLNIATGQVTWTLTAIDPQTGEQPTSALLGLLPPNDETGRGQGFVTYTIQPRATAPTGTPIANNATIIFDTEEPIITNTVANTLDADPPVSAVAALPATSQPTFTVSWSGDDIAGGSGLQSYDIWVSENDGPYQPFISGTTETSAEFTGRPGRTYRFYSIARDNAGNVEAAPSAPDAETRVEQAPKSVSMLTGFNLDFMTTGRSPFMLSADDTNFIDSLALHWNDSSRLATPMNRKSFYTPVQAPNTASGEPRRTQSPIRTRMACSTRQLEKQ